MTWGVNEWVAAGSAVVALISLVLNWLVVRRQTSVQFESLKAQVDAEVMDWAQQAIDILSEGVALARGRGPIFSPEASRQRALEITHRLSAMADRGRLFFPNEVNPLVGQEKEAAFQGVRPPILDAIVFACCQIEFMQGESAGPDEDAAAYLIKCRRLLVSEAQNAIDPRRRMTVLKQLSEGRLDDAKSSHQIAAELHDSLDRRFPNQPTMQAWLEARKPQRASARANARSLK